MSFIQYLFSIHFKYLFPSSSQPSTYDLQQTNLKFNASFLLQHNLFQLQFNALWSDKKKREKIANQKKQKSKVLFLYPESVGASTCLYITLKWMLFGKRVLLADSLRDHLNQLIFYLRREADRKGPNSFAIADRQNCARLFHVTLQFFYFLLEYFVLI